MTADSTPQVRRLVASISGIYRRRDSGELTGRNSVASDLTLERRIKDLHAAMADLPDDAAGNRLYDRANDLVRRYYRV